MKTNIESILAICENNLFGLLLFFENNNMIYKVKIQPNSLEPYEESITIHVGDCTILAGLEEFVLIKPMVLSNN